jgi:hypothetical protein
MSDQTTIPAFLTGNATTFGDAVAYREKEYGYLAESGPGRSTAPKSRRWSWA